MVELISDVLPGTLAQVHTGVDGPAKTVRTLGAVWRT